MIEQRTQTPGLDAASLEGSWITESQLYSPWLGVCDMGKMTYSTAYQSEQHYDSTQTTLPTSMRFHASRDQPLARQDQGLCIALQEVPNLEEREGAGIQPTVALEPCPLDAYPYERALNDPWTQNDNDSLLDIEDCLDPDWESTLIRKSIYDTELEIYLPRDLSPTPVDNLYSTLPRLSRDLQQKERPLKQESSLKPSCGSFLSLNRYQLIDQPSNQLSEGIAAHGVDKHCHIAVKQNLPCGEIRERNISHGVGAAGGVQNRRMLPPLMFTLKNDRGQENRISPKKDNAPLHGYHNDTGLTQSVLQRSPIVCSKVVESSCCKIESPRGEPFRSPSFSAFPPAVKSQPSFDSRYPPNIAPECKLSSPENAFLQQSLYHSSVTGGSSGSGFPSSACDAPKIGTRDSAFEYVGTPTSAKDFESESHFFETSPNSGANYDSMNTRLTHNDIERQRRNQMKIKFNHLKSCLPEISKSERSPKILVLNRARDYIHWLQEEGRVLEQEKDKLKRLNSSLLRTLIRLSADRKGN